MDGVVAVGGGTEPGQAGESGDNADLISLTCHSCFPGRVSVTTANQEPRSESQDGHLQGPVWDAGQEHATGKESDSDITGSLITQ